MKQGFWICKNLLIFDMMAIFYYLKRIHPPPAASCMGLMAFENGRAPVERAGDRILSIPHDQWDCDTHTRLYLHWFNLSSISLSRRFRRTRSSVLVPSLDTSHASERTSSADFPTNWKTLGGALAVSQPAPQPLFARYDLTKHLRRPD